MLKYETKLYMTIQAMVYLRHGEAHRIVGPSRIWHDSEMHWFQYGVPHRIDGMAICLSVGGGAKWLRGKKC